MLIYKQPPMVFQSADWLCISHHWFWHIDWNSYCWHPPWTYQPCLCGAPWCHLALVEACYFQWGKSIHFALAVVPPMCSVLRSCHVHATKSLGREPGPGPLCIGSPALSVLCREHNKFPRLRFTSQWSLFHTDNYYCTCLQLVLSLLYNYYCRPLTISIVSELWIPMSPALVLCTVSLTIRTYCRPWTITHSVFIPDS